MNGEFRSESQRSIASSQRAVSSGLGVSRSCSSMTSSSSTLSMSSLVEQMQKCLQQPEKAGRLAARDEWTTLFQKFKQSIKHLDVCRQDDRVVILAFLHSLPNVSRVHLRQAEFEIEKLFRGMEGDLWVATAADLSSPKSPSSQGCFAEPGPLHSAYSAFKREQPPSRTRECLWVLLLIAAVIVVAVVAICVFNKSGLLVQWLKSLQHAPGMRHVLVLTAAGAAILVFVVICVRLLLTLCRNCGCLTSLVIMIVNVLLMVGLGYCTDWLLNKFLHEEYKKNRALVLSYMLPWNIWVVANTHKFLMQLSQRLMFGALNLWSHISEKCCRRDATCYSHLTLDMQLRMAGKIAGQCDTLADAKATQALLDPDMTEMTYIMKWACLLKKVVHGDADYCFHADDYEELVSSLQGGAKASFCELCCFWYRFISAFCHIISKSFHRNRELSRARSGMKKAMAGAPEHEIVTWQLLLDQYDWYIKHGYCFTDIMARVAGQDAHTLPVVRLLKAVDDMMAWCLCLFCQTPLFSPTPKQRADELTIRLEVVNAFANGSLRQNAISA